jgi:hypothetical protein
LVSFCSARAAGARSTETMAQANREHFMASIV